MFRGINAINLDLKGRFAIPTRARATLGLDVVLTIDTEEPCILLYPKEQWQTIEIKLQSLPSFNMHARRIQRLLIGYASDLEVDNSGRLLLPQLLRDYAQIDKKIMLIGQSNKFEIWDEKIWKEKSADWLAQGQSLLDNLPEEMQNFSL